MGESPAELARRGLDAWSSGDFEAIEGMLDPNVQWRAFEPGEWDCRNRSDVMRTLRERYEQGFAKGEVAISEGGSDTIVVVSHPSAIGGPDWPDETATVMTFRGTRIVAMQDYRTEAEAFDAVARA